MENRSKSTPAEITRLQKETFSIELTRQPILYEALTESVRNTRSGAVVVFLGTVRELTDGKRTLSLEYEAYPAMAMTELEKLIVQIMGEYHLESVSVAHRLGPLELGDIAVGIAVSSPHRAEAFSAASQLMDQIKQTVPIWKKEYWADGSSQWIHPSADEKD